MQTLKYLLIGALLAPLLFAPAVQPIELPDIGDPSGAVLNPMLERRIGDEFMRQVRQSGRMVSDPEVEAYIQSLGYRLVAHSDDAAQDFTFFMVQDGSINAFAAPGGYIGVHTGLMLRTESESELAAVMAHEVAHVTQRHMARSYERASQLSLPMAAAMIGAILLGTQNPEAGSAAVAAISAGAAQYSINFTRANEYEADRVGIHLLARAGFDPHAMPRFFERLHTATRYSDGANLPEFLRTHPVTVSRIAESRARAEQYDTTEVEHGMAYHLTRAKLRVLGERDPNLAVRHFQTALRSGDFQNREATEYGLALALTAAGNHGEARAQLERLLRADPERKAYLLAAARLEIAAGSYADGLAIYDIALSRHPGSRPVVLGYAEALLGAGQPDKARDVLRDYARDHTPRSDPLYYRLLAEAEGRTGAQAEGHLAMAEFYFQIGATGAAREQLELAKKQPDLSYYQRERIDARLKVVEEQLEEEKKLGMRRP